ncbi:MAG: PBP1A family penicillin-binding protein [Clostridia bacterium]|nr:PBP1A family penicillin-binding protein [Clostridia bacterium]
MRKRVKTGKNRKLRTIMRVALCACLACIAGGIFLLADAINVDEWHELDMSLILNAKQSAIIYDKNGDEASILYEKEDRQWVYIDDIPEHVRNAFIAVEDARFYEHSGIDVIRIVGALLHDLKVGAFEQGASTLSQQLIKLSHLTGENAPAEKTIARKAEEAVLAWQMERLYNDKDKILEMYLNYIYFGGGFYGVEAAARGYFGVNAADLTVAQGALLAGVIKSPTNYAPHLDMEASVDRRNLVLRLMLESGFISADEYNSAQAERVRLVESETRNRRSYYIDLVVDEACEALGITKSELITGGYRVYTALDAELQDKVEEVFADPGMYPDERAQAAIVVIDVESGMVSAVMGGREYEVAFGLNRATGITRPPGSAIKPVIAYAPALEYYGYTAASMILDEPTEFDGYAPRNSNDSYHGWVTLREAITYSLNVPAVKVLSGMGVTSGKLFAQRLGIEFDEMDTGLALALGGFTYGVSPWQLARAYSCFASGGVYREGGLVERITDRDGNLLYECEPREYRVMSEANAYILNSMLCSVIADGTGKRLSDVKATLAGKTGTATDDMGIRDAWMAAYNPQYAAAVWMGYDDGTLRLPSGSTGGNYPALMLREVFAWLYAEADAPEFDMPEGVREYRLDAYSLTQRNSVLLATALTPQEQIYTEVFADGTAPSARSDYWAIPAPPQDFEVSVDYGVPRICFTPLLPHIVYTLYREDSNGETRIVGEWTQQTGRVVYYDMAVEYDELYYYYIVPSHPGITVDGRELEGACSRIAHAYIPPEEE